VAIVVNENISHGNDIRPWNTAITSLELIS